MSFILAIFGVLICIFLLVCFIDFKIKESDKKENEKREQNRKLKYYKENKVNDKDPIIRIKSINDTKYNNTKFFIQRNDNVLKLISHNNFYGKAKIIEYNVDDIKSLTKFGDKNYVVKKSQEVHYNTLLQYCGGNPNIGTDCECVININNNVVSIVFQKHTKVTVPDIIHKEYIYAKDIISIAIKSEQQIKENVTLGRLFVFGILAFGMKKEKLDNRYYIVVKYTLDNQSEPIHLILRCDDIQQQLMQLKGNINIAKEYKKCEDERYSILEISNDKIILGYDSFNILKELLLDDLTIKDNMILSNV